MEQTAYKVRRYEARPVTEKRGPGKFRVFTGGGELDEKARGALLKQARPVVFVEGDSRPDLTYLNLLKDDTVVVVLSPPVASEAKAEPATPGTAAPSGAKIMGLIDRLVSPNSPPRIDGPDTEYPKGFDKAAQGRVYDAFHKLSEVGLQAFPYLHARLSDSRYCITMDTGPADENFSVGRVCHLVMDGHLQPWQDPRPGPGRPNYFSHHELESSKAFQSWWGTHKNRSMREIQIEVVEWIIAQEKQKPGVYLGEDVKILKRVLAELQKSDKPFPPTFPFVK